MRKGMRAGLKIWKWGTVVVLLVAVVLFWEPLRNVYFAARLAASIQQLAGGASGQDFNVKALKVTRQNGAKNLEALLYLPSDSLPTTAVVIVAGMSEQGCYHPKLVALSRSLADKGVMVVTPDIQAFREFQISAEPIDQIQFWYEQIPSLEGSGKIRKKGLAGISFSGTLAMMTAARPGIRDQVGFVLAIGPYSSLIRCARDWFDAGPGTESTHYYPTRFYAKWIVMLAALDMIPSANDQKFLHEVLDDLLLQRKVPAARADLTPEGLRWYRLATMPAGKSDPELSKKIEDYLVAGIYPQLDPAGSLQNLRCPVFLIHGAYDDLIPSIESTELHQRIAESYLLITPFLTHTHATETPLSLKQKCESAINALVFCYHLSGALR